MPQGAAATHLSEFIVRADHPSLAGHFPGNPIVPGVLVLEHVICTAESWLCRTLHIGRLTQAKFVSPLLPGQAARVELSLQDDRLTFTVCAGESVVAKGALQLELET